MVGLLASSDHLYYGLLIAPGISESVMMASARDVLGTRKSVPILDSQMSYLDTGVGVNIVLFLHGSPTAAYLWRNVIPHVSPIARCLAPDLIGMGHSGKPEIEYKYADQYKYLSAWIDAMNLPGKITLVVHDWGSGLGFHWGNENRSKVRTFVHMEALVAPITSLDIFPDAAEIENFRAMRSGAGEDMMLKNNMFVEKILPSAIIRKLSDEEMNEYRAPYRDTEISRLPTLMWPRETPVLSDGPEDVMKITIAYNQWLSTDASIPKLFVDAEPGFFSSTIRETVKDWPNQKSVCVKGSHIIQEDSPDDIGKAIKQFLEDVYARNENA